MRECLSDFRIDEWLAHELDADAEGACIAHIQACHDCHQRVRELQAFRQQFANVPPVLDLNDAQRAVQATIPTAPGRPHLVVMRGGAATTSDGARAADTGIDEPVIDGRRQVVTPLEKRRAPGLTVTTGLLAAAAAAMLLVYSGQLIPKATDEALISQFKPGARIPADTRSKGGPRLGVFVKHRGVVRAAAAGEVVAPGDSLQLTYSVDENSQNSTHLAILSRDGMGIGSIYYADGNRAAAIAPGHNVRIPHSIILDDVLGKEDLYALFCREAIDVESVRQQLEQDPGAWKPPSACRVETFRFTKRLP